ncbi:MAG: lytic transglycosylase domain-containing protein [Nitrosarchaeum sp.]|nr:lytic transglycosylase domain-containing protein [Nitrosarchaeum sp.]
MLRDRKVFTEEAMGHRLPGRLTSDMIVNTKPYQSRGRLLRTLRWDEEIRAAEQLYGIPAGMLAGLAMREGLGDPLKLNDGNDGGAGLFQFQPGTARQYGLKVWGDSNRTGRDVAHGRALRAYCESTGWDYGYLARADERFDVNKATDAAARFLSELKERHGSWDAALAAYNGGGSAPSRWKRGERKFVNHVRAVRQYQDLYLRNRDLYVDGQGIDLANAAERSRFFSVRNEARSREGIDIFGSVVRTGDSVEKILADFVKEDQLNRLPIDYHTPRNLYTAEGEVISSLEGVDRAYVRAARAGDSQ